MHYLKKQAIVDLFLLNRKRKIFASVIKKFCQIAVCFLLSGGNIKTFKAAVEYGVEG